jgi:hypothetical protein
MGRLSSKADDPSSTIRTPVEDAIDRTLERKDYVTALLPFLNQPRPKWKPRRGPKPGTVRRYANVDRKFFPELIELMNKEHMTLTAATQHVAPRLEGGGTDKSKAARLAKLFRDENKTR